MSSSSFSIPHPGTGKWIENITFKEAMDKWFEGFNIPRKIVDGKAEDFAISVNRVREYFKKKKNDR